MDSLCGTVSDKRAISMNDQMAKMMIKGASKTALACVTKTALLKRNGSLLTLADFNITVLATKQL